MYKRQTLVGNDVFSLARSQFDTGMYHLQILGSLLVDGFPTVWNGIEAVSYTHLDVYKRQIIHYKL